MNPYLRATDRTQDAPDGWTSEPAGKWKGKEVDVVFDPNRHDVTFIRADISDDIRARFADIGYERMGVDGPNEMWVRDRRSSIDAAWERLSQLPYRERGLEVGGLGR